MTETFSIVLNLLINFKFGLFILVLISFLSAATLIPISGALLTGASIIIGLDTIYYVILPNLLGSMAFLSINWPFIAKNSRWLSSVFNKVTQSEKFYKLTLSWQTVLAIRLSSCLPLPISNILTFICKINLFQKAVLVFIGTGLPSLLYCYAISKITSTFTESNSNDLYFQFKSDFFISSFLLLIMFLLGRYVKKRVSLYS